MVTNAVPAAPEFIELDAELARTDYQRRPTLPCPPLTEEMVMARINAGVRK